MNYGLITVKQCTITILNITHKCMAYSVGILAVLLYWRAPKCLFISSTDCSSNHKPHSLWSQNDRIIRCYKNWPLIWLLLFIQIIIIHCSTKPTSECCLSHISLTRLCRAERWHIKKGSYWSISPMNTIRASHGS